MCVSHTKRVGGNKSFYNCESSQTCCSLVLSKKFYIKKKLIQCNGIHVFFISILFQVNSVFCINEDDRRWKTMCTHPLTRNQGDDRLLGMEECRSPFGNYELHIPVDEELSCSDDIPITHLNCRDLDVSY